MKNKNLRIEINNRVGIKAAQKIIRVVSEYVLNYLKKEGAFSSKRDISLSFALVSEKEIKELNDRYRKRAEPTDVLSFLYGEDQKIFEGEIILCPAVLEKNAQKEGIDFEEELIRNIIHGLLHLVGYEHGKEMFSLQEGLLKNLKQKTRND
ncbi:MAG: rRNA maturation RNase YbeY [Candidatus Moranbacteria bacterium]|nr:rRNA maturation RNase YbeY [Candidatus Moranbacteria bacterium]